MTISRDDLQDLWVGHQRRLYRYLARRLGPTVAEDLTSEAFAQVWAGRDRFDASKGSLVAWLYGVAANLARRHARTEARRYRAYARARAGEAALDLGDPPPDDRLDAERRWPVVAAALASLKDDDREALQLRAWAGLSYEDIAEALGVPEGTVKSRISRARARLDAALGSGAAGVARQDGGSDARP